MIIIQNYSLIMGIWILYPVKEKPSFHVVEGFYVNPHQWGSNIVWKLFFSSWDHFCDLFHIFLQRYFIGFWILFQQFIEASAVAAFSSSQKGLWLAFSTLPISVVVCTALDSGITHLVQKLESCNALSALSAIWTVF